MSYTGWYYSDRSNNIEYVSGQKTEDTSVKTPEIDNNSYVIIEEDFSNTLPSSKDNDENNIQEQNLKQICMKIKLKT